MPKGNSRAAPAQSRESTQESYSSQEGRHADKQQGILTWRAAEPEGEVTSSCLDDSSSFLMASCTTYCWLHHCWRKAVACLWIHSCTCSLVVPEHKASSAGEPATVIFGSALVGMLMTGSSTGVGRGWGFGPSSSLRPRERDFLNCFLPFRKMSDNFLEKSDIQK